MSTIGIIILIIIVSIALKVANVRGIFLKNRFREFKSFEGVTRDDIVRKLGRPSSSYQESEYLELTFERGSYCLRISFYYDEEGEVWYFDEWSETHLAL